jgi:protoporphyrinogen oxidase
MVDTSKKILILGGGPAGMSCAMDLTRAGFKPSIIEKDFKVGGLAKTLEFKEQDHGKTITFRTDIGPHRFFSKNQYLYDYIEDLLDEKWIQVNRQTRQLIEGKFYDYPINAMQAFKNIGFVRAMGMGFSYFAAAIQYKLFKKEINNFEDYIVANFGRKLGEFNMLNYTEKIWGIPSKTIHADWARQRIKGLNLVSALAKALFKKKDGPKSLVSTFYYPQFGTGLIYDTIAEQIKKKGSRVATESYPTKIKHSNGRITSVELSVKGKKKTAKPDHIISSIPITEFINILSPKPPKEVFDAAHALQWRAQKYLFITLDKERITKDNWIYFPNKEVPFGRVAEMKNFSEDMTPKGKTSLFVEFFVDEGDTIWNMDKEELFNTALPFFEELGLFTKEEVRHYYMLQKTHVYPVYDVEYPDHVAVIKKYLDQFENLQYIGRPGRFQYTNQDHSLEMGIVAARSIVEGTKIDLDKIGMENEYFEQGYLKTKK